VGRYNMTTGAVARFHVKRTPPTQAAVAQAVRRGDEMPEGKPYLTYLDDPDLSFWDFQSQLPPPPAA
jgi:hypothetical protein